MPARTWDAGPDLKIAFVPDGGLAERSLSLELPTPDGVLRSLRRETLRDIVRVTNLELRRPGTSWSRERTLGRLETAFRAGKLVLLGAQRLAAPLRSLLEDKHHHAKSPASAAAPAAPAKFAKGRGRVPHRRPPKETVELDGINRPGSPKKVRLETHAAAAYQAMVAHARRDGFEAPLFLIVSGLRDQKRQKELYAKALVKYGSAAEARKWVAPPGKSAHETGCAVDLWLGFACGKENNAKIKDSKAYAWLTKNANDYGFNPYQLEGWHWEYYTGE